MVLMAQGRRSRSSGGRDGHVVGLGAPRKSKRSRGSPSERPRHAKKARKKIAKCFADGGRRFCCFFSSILLRSRLLLLCVNNSPLATPPPLLLPRDLHTLLACFHRVPLLYEYSAPRSQPLTTTARWQRPRRAPPRPPRGRAWQGAARGGRASRRRGRGC